MPRPFSLVSRLTAFFTLGAVAVLLGLGILFMTATERHFVELDDVVLHTKQRLVTDILARAHSPDEARWRLHEALDHQPDIHVVVKDANGEILYQSGGPDSPAAPVLPQQESHPAQGAAFHRLHFQRAPAYDPASVLDVLASLDTTSHAQFFSELWRSFALYGVAATLVSGLLGWFAARQGLAPLRAMKVRAAAVTGRQLGERMPVESVPIEMASLAEEINHMLDRLQEDFQRLSEFSSDLAHELRTPISNLLTQTQVALASRRDAETYREILASNAEEFQRLGRMVSDMLFLAKTERGVDLPSQESFPAAPEARALLEFYEAVADEKRVRLSLRGDGNILGDRLMFRRAVSNLLSNALRHAPCDGEVGIDISTTARTTAVTVENTGNDIDPKMLPRLFDRFLRADPSRAHPGTDGAGLGLSITHAIVRAHGGTIAVLSTGGRTRFRLEFPRPS